MENLFSIIDYGHLKKYKNQIIGIMKKSLIIGCILFLSTNAFAFSQKISLQLGQVSLGQALKGITSETNINFFYSDNELDVNKMVTANFADIDLIIAVQQLVGSDYEVQAESTNIVLIFPSNKKMVPQSSINGKITDENGVPLMGVNVIVKNENRGTTTNFDGEYSLMVKADAVLIFSYVSYLKQEIEVNNRSIINISMAEDVSQLKEVIITGIVERKKESFTGAINTITGDELKSIGNQNIVQSIKALDPSFVVLENSQFGSNPNRLPNIQVRGKSSVSTTELRDEFDVNPNQPLFVLDGFETDLRTIVDLDMNRVKSITILKDATSTSLYGAKAANGVVVVETLRPKPGELRLSYTSDLTMEFPDLRDYNLMNAEEKIKFEKLSGRWDDRIAGLNYHPRWDSIYNSKLADVKRGVNTYWLDEPVQTGFSHRHSLNVEGGNEDLLFRAGVNFKDQSGVMIGSGRQTWGGNLDVTYRKNKLNITNRLYVSGSDANESRYGDFSKFARANPYYRRQDEGGAMRYLDKVDDIDGLSYSLENPLHSSTLNNRDHTKGFSLQNTLEAIYTINSEFRVSGGLQLKKGNSIQEIFVSPKAIEFDEVGAFEKGRYSNFRNENFSYFGNIMLTYSTVLDEVHSVNANLRADVEETRNERYATVAVGFPTGTNGNPNFAFGYEPDDRPEYGSSLYRRNNILTSVNYAYDRKYLFDGTFRMDGSTAFGSNRRYSPFWSVGLGWNIHNEFVLDENVIGLLKIRANIGSTGNQNFGSVATTSIYGFNSLSNSFGQGIELEQLANNNLEWQKTLQSNIGLDFQMFGDRLNGSIEYFNKRTDPLIVAIDLPSSTGVQAYPFNVGNLNVSGFETILKYSPIYNIENQIVWTLGVTATSYISKYGGLDNALEDMDQRELESKSLLRFRDGFSPDDIWAVQSLGIDPATGREVFLQANGQHSYIHNFQDEKVVGNTTPKMEGVISSNLNYKGILFGVNLRYRFGGDIFNNALYEKVENISYSDLAYNQDKRALYDRWQQPGDISKFSAINNRDMTPISSRFVQQENVLIGESISLGYQTANKEWLSNLGLSSLRLNAYMNDMFRWSTVTSERGTEYPFSRSVSLSVNASF